MKILQRITLLLILTGFFACNTSTDNGSQPADDSTAQAPPKTTKYEVANWDGCMVSAYIYQEDGRHLVDTFDATIAEFEALIGHETGSIMWYPTFADEFPLDECQKLVNMGIIPHLTWELFVPGEVDYNTMPIDTNYYMMDDVLAGKYDDYIQRFANDAKQVNGKVLIRFLHEFNGNWYLWSGNKNGRENGGPEKVVAVWKYVVDQFRAAGANNVKWIWNPHGPSVDVSDEAWNDLQNYWPGSDYVDWIGMDAYNWYPQDPWGGERPFRTFDNCFRDLYNECIALGDQPVMIAEFASPEFEYNGQTKDQWISDAMTKIKTEYPRLKMFVWFHINKELDWRINSSPEALQAFKSAIQDDYFVGRVMPEAAD